ncbi:MAG: CDP-diacylglycerol--glycerol-3-phosphate 3-phosphatidyltransferase [Thermoleophilia bacterium]
MRPEASSSGDTDQARWRLPVNLANSITLLRILLIPVFMVFMLGLDVIPYRDAIAVTIFGLAAATDKLDGYLARSRDSVTVLGTFLDPLADKLLISAALISLVELGRISAWIAMVIISREFAVSGLRLVAAVERVVIPASGFGKIKTFSQIVAVTALILPEYGFIYGRPVSWYLINVAALITVASGVDYFLKARDRLRMPESFGVAAGE